MRFRSVLFLLSPMVSNGSPTAEVILLVMPPLCKLLLRDERTAVIFRKVNAGANLMRDPENLNKGSSVTVHELDRIRRASQGASMSPAGFRRLKASSYRSSTARSWSSAAVVEI